MVFDFYFGPHPPPYIILFLYIVLGSNQYSGRKSCEYYDNIKQNTAKHLLIIMLRVHCLTDGPALSVEKPRYYNKNIQNKFKIITKLEV